MAKNKGKNQVRAPQVKTKEVPKRSDLPAAESSGDRICWRFCHVDHEGPWGFEKVDALTLRKILDWLSHLESMKMNEIFNFQNYPGTHYEVETIPNATALARLEELGLADMTKIHKLRQRGKVRLFGFLVENVFHVVWWDPEHEVWPYKLKHT